MRIGIAIGEAIDRPAENELRNCTPVWNVVNHGILKSKDIRSENVRNWCQGTLVSQSVRVGKDENWFWCIANSRCAATGEDR